MSRRVLGTIRRTLRHRQAARVLLVDDGGRVLLCRFVHRHGALAAEDYWATPGGGLQDGETFAETGVRDLAEGSSTCS